VPNFIFVVPYIAELACGEQSRTQSLTQSHSLFDVPGTEAFALELQNSRQELHDLSTSMKLVKTNEHSGFPGNDIADQHSACERSC